MTDIDRETAALIHQCLEESRQATIDKAEMSIANVLAPYTSHHDIYATAIVAALVDTGIEGIKLDYSHG